MNSNMTDKVVSYEHYIYQRVYEFIEKHYGEPLKHSDHFDELRKMINDICVNKPDQKWVKTGRKRFSVTP